MASRFQWVSWTLFQLILHPTVSWTNRRGKSILSFHIFLNNSMYSFREHFCVDRQVSWWGCKPPNRRLSCHSQSTSERGRSKAINSLKHRSSLGQLNQRPLHYFMLTLCYTSVNLLCNAKVTLLSIDQKSLFPLRWNICWNWFHDWPFCHRSRG